MGELFNDVVLASFGVAVLVMPGWACGGDTSSQPHAAASAFAREVTELCNLTPTGDSLSTPLEDALSRGVAVFQPEQAERCLLWLRDHGCLHSTEPGVLSYLELRLPGLCRLAYAGSIPPGEPCSASAACAGDSSCLAEVDFGAGRCKPRLAAGEACVGVDACAAEDEQIPNCARNEEGKRRCSVESR